MTASVEIDIFFLLLSYFALLPFSSRRSSWASQTPAWSSCGRPRQQRQEDELLLAPAVASFRPRVIVFTSFSLFVDEKKEAKKKWKKKLSLTVDRKKTRPPPRCKKMMEHRRPRTVLSLLLLLALLLAASAESAAKSTLQQSSASSKKFSSSPSPLRLTKRGEEEGSIFGDLGKHHHHAHPRHRRSRRDDTGSQQTCVPPVYNTTSKR